MNTLYIFLGLGLVLTIWLLRRSRRPSAPQLGPDANRCQSCESTHVQLSGTWVHCPACGYTKNLQETPGRVDLADIGDITRPADPHRSFW